jgi:hypothetical protein
MIDLVELERLDFKGGDARSKLDDVLSEVAAFVEARTAAEVAQLLQRKRRDDPSLAQAIDPYVAKFQALALPLLTDRVTLGIFEHLATIVADERIGLYERLRARLLALPITRRSVLAQQILAALRSSRQPLGRGTIAHQGTSLPAMVGSWMRVFETQGWKNPQAMFQMPEFKRLNDQDDHRLRHIVHLATLLAAPETIELEVAPMVGRAETVASAATPIPPVNLPVAPVAAPAVPRPTPQPIPRVDRGPTMASVIARLQQSQQATVAEPPTVAHLTPDDEQEIRQHAATLAGLPAGPNVQDAVNQAIDRIIRAKNLNFIDDNVRRRFMTTMSARIKDIRTSNETLELLTRAEKIGGLGYDQALADQLVTAASAEAARFQDHGEVQRLVVQQAAAAATPMPKPPRVPAPTPSISPSGPPAGRAGMGRVVPPPPTAPAAAAPRPSPVPPRPVTSPTPMTRSTPTPAWPPPMPTAATRPLQLDRATMADIRGRSRLVGPVEELRGLTVVDWRRLGPDPIGCVRRVYEKIQQLGRESFTKRAEGIKAWRESEPYRLYLDMGHESLLTSKSVRDVLFSRQQAGQPALTEPEFSLIADLNRKLRF